MPIPDASSLLVHPVLSSIGLHVPWYVPTSMYLSLACLAAALILVPWSLRRLLRQGAFDRREALIVLGFVLVAFALRWFLPEHVLIHENRHGFRLLPGARNVGFWDAANNAATLSHGVFTSHGMLATLMERLIGAADAFQVLGALCSSLTVGAVYALARQLTGSRAAAWTTAAALATLPVALLMAPTEECLVTAALFITAGAALVRGRSGPQAGGGQVEAHLHRAHGTMVPQVVEVPTRNGQRMPVVPLAPLPASLTAPPPLAPAAVS